MPEPWTAWAAKQATESQIVLVMLLPLVNDGWLHRNILNYFDIFALTPRVNYLRPDGELVKGVTFGSMFAVSRGHARRGSPTRIESLPWKSETIAPS